jgi:UTP--glucose-1-phosphate uridylyltransferase
VRFIPQPAARGYGHAVLCGHEFIGDEPFLHLVGDHLHVAKGDVNCARQLIEVANADSASVSAVQPTRENQLTSYGAVGGHLIGRDKPLYQIETVLEKPTPTVAEQQLIVPGLRAGFYLCFFGMHVLGPRFSPSCSSRWRHSPTNRWPVSCVARPGLPPALPGVLRRGPPLRHRGALRLLLAQLALSLSGRDRDHVLTQLVELLAVRAD